ncbi:2-dehydro-3-deoxygluconokinase [Devosia limi DSM 17137]|uniref:2-dehydro-3-deoxygluconokinase n=1 Tax=Devosia limi DSM 17137 TaxID=1121477 RepID=A0A0F5L4C5_9HYPH|nr:sugar kinase [Devosia limi]KKB77065.1 2-dehydro-3-deoxygluconokinase [Devosia limi DSM 17137]SHF41612.1 2-keto-3-deoxygluconate kinase [Devosia limi DSM 17137]
MTQKRFVSIGECMIEMSGGEDRQYRLGYAGDTLNTSWYMRALLGDDWSVDYFTALGDDRYSGEIRNFLEANNIGTSHIATIKGRRPGLYMIHQEKGDRHFTYWRDTSAAKLLAEDKDALNAALDGASMVYFSGITLAILHPRARGRLLGAIVKARDAGAKVAFDPNVRPALWTNARVMGSMLTAAASLCDIVLPTHSDEAPIFGDNSVENTAERYLELGVEEVVVKDGADPALIATASERVKVGPKPGAVVVDATGAGDSFNGAYLSARLAGKSLAEAAEAAHRVAGIVIGQKGALVDPTLLR